MTITSRSHGRTALTVAALLISVVAIGIAASSAFAADGPQFGSIGQYGELFRGGGFDSTAFDGGKYDKPLTAGKFIDPVGLAVDSSDKTTGGDGTAEYVLDRTSNLPGAVTGTTTTWRLQKLDDKGNVLGTDRFSLPVDANNDEVFGLAIDPTAGDVYALLVSFNAGLGAEVATQVIGWSTTPDGSGHLSAGSGLSAGAIAKGITGFAAPGVLSTTTQLTSAGSPVIVSPEGLALDVSAGVSYLAVQGNDPTTDGGGAGIAQICAQSACGSSARGALTRKWSSTVLNGLPNDLGSESSFPPGGISTAADGSLTVLLNEQSVGSPSDVDVVDVPADLTSKPTILAAINNAPESPPGNGEGALDFDNASVLTSGLQPELSDPDGLTPANDLASAQIVGLSNGLYVGEFEPDLPGSPDPQNPAGNPGIWTAHSPGARLLMPAADKTISNVDLPLTSLFDTLGNPAANKSGVTEASSACNLSDSVTAAGGDSADPIPSFAAGAGGAIWVLTRGSDSSTQGSDQTGGRELIELAPNAGDPCPTPSGTFSVALKGTTAQPASVSTPLTINEGATVNFDASTIDYQGGATSQYSWNFGDGHTAINPEHDDTTFPSTTTSETYTKPGVYTATLTVNGDFGLYVETGTINVIPSTPPTGSFTLSPPNPDTTTAVNFDGSASTPSPGAAITDYHWDWGDGTSDDTPSASDSHTYANPGTYTVSLTIHDNSNGTSSPVTQSVTVVAVPPVTTTTTTTPPPPTTSTSTTPTPPPPTIQAPKIEAKFSSTTSKQGVVSTVVTCPTGQTSCSGTVTLKTAKAVVASVARRKAKPHKAILTLGSARFTISGGKHKTVHITLKGKALSLLRKSHTLKTVATIRESNPQGKTTVKSIRVTLHYPKVKPKKHHKK